MANRPPLWAISILHLADGLSVCFGGGGQSLEGKGPEIPTAKVKHVQHRPNTQPCHPVLMVEFQSKPPNNGRRWVPSTSPCDPKVPPCPVAPRAARPGALGVAPDVEGFAACNNTSQLTQGQETNRFGQEVGGGKLPAESTQADM